MHKPRRAGFLGLAAGLALLAAPVRAADPNTDFAAYRRLFSVAALGALRGPSTVIGYTLHYRGATPHAGFLVSGNGNRIAWRVLTAAEGPDAVRDRLEATCAQEGAAVCRIVALDGAVPGLALPPFRPVVAAIGPFRAAPLMFRHGPQAAEGVIVFSHGYGGPQADRSRRLLPGVTAMLNDAGWDVMEFERDPAEDHVGASLPALSRALPMLHRAGYRRVVLAGQSRGAWQSVMAAAERPELVHAVIALAPAAHGQASGPNTLGVALDDFRRLLAGLPADGPRLAVAVFEGDPFDPDPAARAALVAGRAGSRSAPTLALHPERPVEGHGGGNHWRFTQGHGPCLMSLVRSPEAAAPRGLRRAACGGG
jgi:pimeloyl-ACP methyl ester carboxylesterase